MKRNLTSLIGLLTLTSTLGAAQAADLPQIEVWQRGDVTGDGVLDLSDADALARHVQFGEPLMAPPFVKDASQDGVVDAFDPLWISNALQSGDPTADEVVARGSSIAILADAAYDASDASSPIQVTVDPVGGVTDLLVTTGDALFAGDRNITNTTFPPYTNGTVWLAGDPVDAMPALLVEFHDPATGTTGFLALSSNDNVVGEITALRLLGDQHVSPSVVIWFLTATGNAIIPMPLPSPLTGWSAVVTDGVEFSASAAAVLTEESSVLGLRETRKTTATDIEMFHSVEAGSSSETDAGPMALKLKPLGDRVLVESGSAEVSSPANAKNSFTLPGIGKLRERGPHSTR